MPLVNISMLRKIDYKILKATGYKLIPVSDDCFVLSLNGRDFVAIPYSNK